MTKLEKILYTAKVRTTRANGPSMTDLGRSLAIGLLLLGVLVLAPMSWAQTRPQVAQKIAETYGLDSFGQIEAIRYTFNLQFPGVNVSRSWEWEPRTNKVSYEGTDKDGKPVKVTYVRSELGSQSDAVKNNIDPAFINDQYDLFFPLHVFWDSSSDVQDLGVQKLPLGTGSARRVVVKYPSEAGGYNPGDTWELFIGSNGRVQELVYHRSGPKPPSLVTASWTGYKKAGPLLIATEWRGTADGKPLRLSYSNVSVKLPGSDTWMKVE